MVGEIGGDEEEKAAAFIAEHMTKPVVAYIAGFTAPPGKTMGHAGAIISGSSGTAAGKKAALERFGIAVGTNPTEAARWPPRARQARLSAALRRWRSGASRANSASVPLASPARACGVLRGLAARSSSPRSRRRPPLPRPAAPRGARVELVVRLSGAVAVAVRPHASRRCRLRRRRAPRVSATAFGSRLYLARLARRAGGGARPASSAAVPAAHVRLALRTSCSNALAVDLPVAEPPRLAAVPGVTRVYPSRPTTP